MVAQAALDAVAHYQSKGIAIGPAVGIVAVCLVESGLNPAAENNTGTETPGVLNPKGSYGIAQWNGPRQAALQAFATAKGESPSALNTQLDFILTECANSYPVVWSAIQAGVDYSSFVTTFVQNYERPANPTAEIAAAMTYAQQIIAALPAVTTPTTGVTMEQQIITLLAPLIEAVISGLFKAIIAQLSTSATTATNPTTASLESLASGVASTLLPQLQTLIQSEIAKIGVKS
jgi:hypothetical protein